MAVATDDLLARVLAAAEPAERSLRRQMLDVLLSPAQPARMSYEEFLAWADEDTLAEWVNGEVLMASPASLRHQSIGHFLAQVIGVYVEEHDLGTLIVPPFQMRLTSSGREPDLLFVAAEHLHRLRDTYLDRARQSPRPSLRSNRAIASNVRPAAAVANYARIAQPEDKATMQHVVQGRSRKRWAYDWDAVGDTRAVGTSCISKRARNCWWLGC